MTTTALAAPTVAATGRARTATRRRSPARRRSTPLTIAMLAALAYLLLPLSWLAVASTKSTQDLFGTFGLWFSRAPQLLSNIRATLTHDHGSSCTGCSTPCCTRSSAQSGPRCWRPPPGTGSPSSGSVGDRAGFNLVLGAIMVPTTALAIPTYLLFAKVGLVNTPWAVILPSLVSPFGLYLMRIYAEDAVPGSLIEAARIDGAGEAQIFFRIACGCWPPGW